MEYIIVKDLRLLGRAEAFGMCDALTSPRAAMKRAPSGRRAYGLVRPLGEGSFGSVSLVAHKVTGDEVVIKEVRLKGLSRPCV